MVKGDDEIIEIKVECVKENFCVESLLIGGIWSLELARVLG